MSNVSSEFSSELTSPKPVPAAEPKGKKDAVRWGPGAAIFISLGAFILAQFVVYFLISLWFLVVQNHPWATSSSEWLDSIAGQFCYVALSAGFILLAVGLFLRRRRASFRQLGFGRAPVLADIALAFIGFVVYFLLLIGISSLVQQFTKIDVDQRQELGFDMIATNIEKLLAFASLVILPPLMEETVFRGFLFTGLRSKLPFVGATLITSLLFAAPHLLASSHGPLWIAGIDTFLLSLVLCYLREKTGALWAPMLVHGAKNSIAFILFLAYIATQ
jgi:membrane protease YdiL (CAAX protease family)